MPINFFIKMCWRITSKVQTLLPLLKPRGLFHTSSGHLQARLWAQLHQSTHFPVLNISPKLHHCPINLLTGFLNQFMSSLVTILSPLLLKDIILRNRPFSIYHYDTDFKHTPCNFPASPDGWILFSPPFLPPSQIWYDMELQCSRFHSPKTKYLI